ncbi:MAG: hypothetical protein GY830_06675 [Bacteroidetes bacterium]|nr:hypothetical protein [Bacteroidota bacterium]
MKYLHKAKYNKNNNKFLLQVMLIAILLITNIKCNQTDTKYCGNGPCNKKNCNFKHSQQNNETGQNNRNKLNQLLANAKIDDINLELKPKLKAKYKTNTINYSQDIYKKRVEVSKEKKFKLVRHIKSKIDVKYRLNRHMLYKDSLDTKVKYDNSTGIIVTEQAPLMMLDIDFKCCQGMGRDELILFIQQKLRNYSYAIMDTEHGLHLFITSKIIKTSDSKEIDDIYNLFLDQNNELVGIDKCYLKNCKNYGWSTRIGPKVFLTRDKPKRNIRKDDLVFNPIKGPSQFLHINNSPIFHGKDHLPQLQREVFKIYHTTELLKKIYSHSSQNNLYGGMGLLVTSDRVEILKHQWLFTPYLKHYLSLMLKELYDYLNNCSFYNVSLAIQNGNKKLEEIINQYKKKLNNSYYDVPLLSYGTQSQYSKNYKQEILEYKSYIKSALNNKNCINVDFKNIQNGNCTSNLCPNNENYRDYGNDNSCNLVNNLINKSDLKKVYKQFCLNYNINKSYDSYNLDHVNRILNFTYNQSLEGNTGITYSHKYEDKEKKYYVFNTNIALDNTYAIYGVVDVEKDQLKYLKFKSHFIKINKSLFDPLPKHLNQSSIKINIPKNNLFTNNTKLNQDKKASLNSKNVKLSKVSIELPPIKISDSQPYIKHICANLNKDIKKNEKDKIIARAKKCVQYGNKKQISRSIFKFQDTEYTVILSQSLKTILCMSPIQKEIMILPQVIDKSINNYDEFSDYNSLENFVIKLKKQYKPKERNITKSEYKKQYIYTDGKYKLFFASDHSTVIELLNQVN